MSAVPEDFMRDPTHPPGGDGDSREAPAEPREEGRAGTWQWLFIAVLLACWLAEATLCVRSGY